MTHHLVESPYDSRPWLSLYDSGLATELGSDGITSLDMFRAAARQAPDSPALHYFDASITWRELDDLSDALAVGLQDRGVRLADRVACFMQNVPQFVISMLATWKVGGTIVLVNPMLKARELDVLLQDCGAVVLIALESLYTTVGVHVVPASSVHTVITTSELDLLGTGADLPAVLGDVRRGRPDGSDDLLEVAAACAGRRPVTPPHDAAHVAALTYTSGTTGAPKGAMGTHANVVFSSHAYRTWADLDAEDVVLGISPLCHVTGLVGHVGASFAAACPLVLAYRFDAGKTLELIERHGVTFTVAANGVFAGLMNHPDAAHRDISSMTKIWGGGIASTDQAFEQRFGPHVHAIYGLTEATGPTHCVPMGRRAPRDPASGALSVGIPVFNTISRIVDDDGREVPPGHTGEIVSRGPQIAAGYWNQPEETERSFRPAGLRTGDVGFMDPEGWFYIVDRKKEMIAAGGYKVWPREVEDVLYEHPAVREAAVVGVPDEYRGETVKAFVSLEPGLTTTPADLIAFSKERLAAYKYPREVEIRDELPKTPIGKVMRHALRPPARAGEGPPDGPRDRT